VGWQLPVREARGPRNIVDVTSIRMAGCRLARARSSRVRTRLDLLTPRFVATAVVPSARCSILGPMFSEAVVWSVRSSTDLEA
jgi:hypothetical protein